MNSLHSWEHLTKCPTDVRPTVRRSERKGAYSEAHKEAEGPHRVCTPYLGNHLILSSCNICWRQKITCFHLQSCREYKHGQTQFKQTIYISVLYQTYRCVATRFSSLSDYYCEKKINFSNQKQNRLVEPSHPGRQSPHTALLVVEQLPFWKRLMSPQSRQGLHFCRLRSSLKRLLRQGTHRASSP